MGSKMWSTKESFLMRIRAISIGVKVVTKGYGSKKFKECKAAIEIGHYLFMDSLCLSNIGKKFVTQLTRFRKSRSNM